MMKLSILRRILQASSKKYFAVSLLAVIFLVLSSSYALNGRSMSVIGKRFMSMWTWMGGSSIPNDFGAYGTVGSSASVAPIPGAREGSCSWTDSSGNKWFFGGYMVTGSNYYNDLWKYNPTAGDWTWVSGSNVPNASASYGVQGVAADTNVPGPRRDCATWVDPSGVFWMFGGDVGTSNTFNDLWKYNPTSNQWTWMTGSTSSINAAGVYGTQGTAAAGNTPGGRYNPVTWLDASGNLWLHGGGQGGTYYNDLWKFNTTTNQWTWVNGSNAAPAYSVYGTKGSSSPVPPFPGSRQGAATWIDSSGNLWLFGGLSTASNEYFNDFWKYNPSMDQWTWMSGSYMTNQANVSGTKGVPSTANIPYRRAYATTWIDSNGKFWMFGGIFGGPTYHNSLWKYDPTTSEWTWVSGSIDGTFNPSAVYGTKGVAAAANIPSGRTGAIGWLDGTKLWIFGGTTNIPFADLWMYDISADRWTWMAGPTTQDSYGVFGTQGSSAVTTQLMSARKDVTTWVDSSGNQWFFGGSTSTGVTNELWKYNPTTDVWTWVSGSSAAGDAGTYGTKGVAAASNVPKSRAAAAGWVDGSDNLWLFGGVNGGYLNDLWKFDTSTNQWTWIAGINGVNTVGVFGTLGTPSTSNYPGSRSSLNIAKDSSGNVWFFGGYGYALAGGVNYLNDLWKYNPGTGEWTWMSGSSTSGSAAVWGTKGTPSTSNYPSARTDAAMWIDASDNVWIFGASASGGTYNDMWRFKPSTSEWTWVTGANAPGAGATTGTKGVPAASNTPRAKFGAPHGKDSAGNFWIYGGRDNTGSYYGDIFKFDPTTSQWTWISGVVAASPARTYGTKGVASTSNTPGGRAYTRAFMDSSDNFWLFGGSDSTNSYADHWKYVPSADTWTWVTGSNLAKFVGVYGTVGTSTGVATYPGSRQGGVAWVDSSGNFWMFGGYGNASTAVSRDALNDLWKYDKTLNEWTWMNGTAMVGSAGTYGTKGTAAADNTPGARYAISAWKDSSADVLWLYGGHYAASYYNDAWKYDVATNQWTWISGANTSNSNGTYGTKGVASTANVPGSRHGSGSWLDASGNVWIFGGYGYPASGGSGYLSDLWKFNPSTTEWTWVSGASTVNAAGVYGTKGSSASVPVVPGGRYGSISWKDSSGKFWLYGGMGYLESNFSGGGFLGDLWKYDPAANTWMWASGNVVLSDTPIFGTKGTPSTAVYPGGRVGAISWIDASDMLWLFGGSNGNRWNDLWKFNPSTTEWTWVSGPNTGNSLGTYGTKGTPSTSYLPSSRYKTVGWSTDTSTLWLFGGDTAGGYFNDLWKYNAGTNEWTWMSGSSAASEIGVYGNKGTSAPVPPMPIVRSLGVSWTAADGTLWMFGGTNSLGNLNDLWKYNPSTGVWTWMSGSNLPGNAGTYGTKGTAAPTNVPGSRHSASSWADSSGNLWMFGGYNGGYLNDLWKYSTATGQWTWMSGSSSSGVGGTYGTQGTANAANVPGSRSRATTWIDSSGNLWLFGGANSNRFNDLWKYDVTSGLWTWMSGSNTTNGAAVYGTQGVANAANIPGARYSSVGLYDVSGNLWLFAGYETAYLNDLWKYDIAGNVWTWVSGSSSANSNGSAGTLGIASTANSPRSRQSSMGWMDSNNNLWFFSGFTSISLINDLWRYNIPTGKWTWMSGVPSVSSTPGTYGVMGVPAIANSPGGRQSGMTWVDSTGNFWLFGGNGYGAASSGYLNDMWRYRVK